MRLSLRLGGLVLAATALSGCLVGPDYKTASPPPGSAGPWVSATPANATAATAPDDWWRLYDDPRLDGYVREAFAANDNLVIAEANLAAARAILEATRAGHYPSTTLGFDAVRGRDPVTNEILEINGHKPVTIWKFDDLFDVSWELDIFGRIRRSVEAAHADAEAVAAERDGVKITVAAETARAYAQICSLGEQLDVARHNLDVVSREAEITVNRRVAGAGSEFEQVRAETLVAQVRSAIPPLEGQRRAALFQLAALLNRPPSHAPVEALACTTTPALAAPLPVGDGAGLLRRRPDIREAERRLASATARVGVATAELYPTITFTGFYGAAATQIPQLTKNAGLAWGVGPSIHWAFPNQAIPRAKVRQARAGEQAALAGFDDAVLQALKETEQSLATYGSELDHHTALVDAQTKARRTYELAHGQFLAGATTQLDLLSAEQTVVGAEAAVASSNAALAQDQIAVFKALGGGWAPQPGRQVTSDRSTPGSPAAAP
jgi:NodT family efflux transporter outer membrane factor (OMF) lipoprotein